MCVCMCVCVYVCMCVCVYVYHATRKMAEQYKSSTLTMLLEIGLRTDSAGLMWKRLHMLERSGVWAAASMQRSGLAQRLAKVTGQ